MPGSAERRTRQGFIALGRVEDYAAGVVFRHERTLAGPKVDRLELLRHTHTNTGQLFMLYDDPERRIDDVARRRGALRHAGRGPRRVRRRSSALAGLRSGGYCRAWCAKWRRVSWSSPTDITVMRPRSPIAMNAARKDGSGKPDAPNAPDAPYEQAMMTFFNTRGEGLLILPTHRVVAQSGLHSTPIRFARTWQARSTPRPTLSPATRRARRPTRNFVAIWPAMARKGHAIGMYGRGVFCAAHASPGRRPRRGVARFVPGAAEPRRGSAPSPTARKRAGDHSG